MKIKRLFYVMIIFLMCTASNAQKAIPTLKIIETEKLASYLKEDAKKEFGKGKISEAVLAKYYRQKFSERFFYDWHTFTSRFDIYKQMYQNAEEHKSRAEDHMQKYKATTTWQLPFYYQNGTKVDAYAVRHLARQHKMVDIAFQYFYENKNPKYLQYFLEQRNSLSVALKNDKYEKEEDGNGTYEVFHCGYRVLNWLMIHNMFLGENLYTDHDQLFTISTLLQHGAFLYEQNDKFKPGNHQTRGVSALAMIAILLRDFKQTDLWYSRAMERLGEHLDKEINNDGFQFERSVHYHISDIENYFYVYQLAQNSKIHVDEKWKNKLESLFTSLIKIAYPDKSAPVLQDDTDNPWAEKNDISGALTLGYLLFDSPEMGYFAEKKVDGFIYWFLGKNQIEKLNTIDRKTPEYGSLQFPDTRYYIMRNGWNKNDNMMIISAGVDSIKSDHQHGDILGVQAMANGQVILPNYQVNYPIADFYFFKNSLVKNVALVDDELQGKEWALNHGGSGFGKFKNLPQPTTIAWETTSDFDFFAGSHNGFENIGVKYSRQVIDVKNDFWIVKDNFTSELPHEYKQVWQGHYTTELVANLIRSNFADASGCDIYQLISTDNVSNSGTRGKQWSVVSKKGLKNFNFITVIFPYSGYSKRIDETKVQPDLKKWKLNSHPFIAEGNQLRTLTKDNNTYLFNVRKVNLKGLSIDFSDETDLFIQIKVDEINIYSISDKKVNAIISGSKSNNPENAVFYPGKLYNILIY